MKTSRFQPIMVAAALVLAGCTSEVVDHKDFTRDMDFVVGSGFVPKFNLASSEKPKQVLLLPVTGTCDDGYMQAFSGYLKSELMREATFQVVSLSDTASGRQGLAVTRQAAFVAAHEAGCDAIMSVRVDNHRPVQPIRLMVDTIIEMVDSGVVLSGSNDYDTQNKQVANSARSYYQTRMQKTAAINKSMSILESNDAMFKYMVSDTVQGIKNAFFVRDKAKVESKNQEEPKPSFQTK